MHSMLRTVARWGGQSSARRNITWRALPGVGGGGALALRRPLMFIRNRFGGDADLHDSSALQRIHYSNQFLHGQISIGSNHNGDLPVQKLIGVMDALQRAGIMK